ncbi:MAG: UTP--glucose-1-phosphate uridylyltransferase [Verrucomicrobia bacterium]|nr:UTP--glucose-1-phosphate uridylyltransferase [Verrucomicrobiota bacterium]
MNTTSLDQVLAAKMRAAGVAGPTITAFLGAVHKVIAGERGMLPESSVESVTALPRLDDLSESGAGDTALLKQLVVVKLNGGLGTSMGLDRAKSLLPVKGPDTFLDFIARQILHLRASTGGPEPAFYLMDSFSTQQDTVDYLRKYPALSGGSPRGVKTSEAPAGSKLPIPRGEPLDFLQNMVPKLDAKTFESVSWPAQPDLEWCPPGHGDIYPSLLGSGLLDKLLARGIKFMFVSNADNLGATVDLKLLRYVAAEGLSFLMEVAERTAMDRKGGHLARGRSHGRLLLRESAQCPKDDEAAFQDIERHRFFNTNNLWVRLDHLKTELDRNGGAIPLPLITNTKTVDPRNPASPKVLQLESAMGAAIECFEQTGALVVPRSRFAPVKTTSDLLVLRSDACRVTDDHRLVLVDERNGQPPLVDLDQQHYKLLADFERYFADGAPSLVHCDSLTVRGPVRFAAGVVCEGQVEIVNAGADVKTLGPGKYRATTLQL